MQCDKCNSSWDNKAGMVLGKCPFCQADIEIVDDRTPDEKMRFIGNKYGVDLYHNPDNFCSVINDNFSGEDDAGRLLKFLINHDACKLVLTLKDLPDDQVKSAFDNIVDELERCTFTSVDKLLPAVALLCVGLGVDGFLSDQTSSNSVVGDFEIVDGVLVKYHGSGGDVIVPDSVTKIGECAFWCNVYLVKVTLPYTVKVIVARAFSGCKNLTFIHFDDTITIGYGAFNGCRKIERYCKKRIKRINASAFK